MRSSRDRISDNTDRISGPATSCTTYNRRMIRAERQFSSELVLVDRFDHPADVPHVDPSEEQSEHFSLNFVERGAFMLHVGVTRARLSASNLFATVPGMRYWCRHDERDRAPGDVCIAVRFLEAVPDVDLLHQRFRLARPSVVPLTNRRRYLQQRLLGHLGHSTDTLALELLAGDLLHSVTHVEPAVRLYKATQLSWYAVRVDRARELLDVGYASPQTLASLARVAGMSPYQFARVFRELTGCPPHRYLVARRLRAALERLRAGASVTETCFAVGFRNLSHFIRAFRATYGVSPSRWRSVSSTTMPDHLLVRNPVGSSVRRFDRPPVK